ncbi:TRAP transporter large permease [Moorella sulfitireducens]|uniref:TRAP transporter large permease n=1 Tax=Neomoorella sulfitireducens TaxID=2972948 RepID=UPI0021AD0606|nr:TRAP transporter large permease [Moorella sulfitireducens]
MSLVITFVLCLVIGVPIMATIGMATLVPILLEGKVPLTLIPQVLYTGVDQFPLIAVSGFILAGALMEAADITDRIIEVARRVVGSFTGGLAAVTILACAIFAALSGSGPATTAAIGSLAIPMMTRFNYDKNFAAGVSSAGGALGILIPPSNPMIIYGVTANISVAKMFMAGFVPGIFVTLVLILTAIMVSRKKGYTGTGEGFSLKKTFQAIWDGRWALLAPLIILGGIYGGVFTPTEAAEIAVIYSFFVGTVIYRKLTPAKIYKALVDASLMTGTIIVIVGIAVAFGRLLTLYRIPQTVAAAIQSISSNPQVVLLLISALLLFIGTWMETLSQVIVLTPIFLPLVQSLGIDPIHFGIIFVLWCEIGFLTPPLGANLYVATKLANISLEEVTSGIFPFLIAYIICVLIIIFFPQITLWLPNLLMP